MFTNSTFNITLFYKVFHITPWLIYNVPSKSDNKFCVNEYSNSFFKYAKESDSFEYKTFYNEFDDMIDSSKKNDELIVRKRKIIKYVPKFYINSVCEDDFVIVGPSYMTILGITLSSFLLYKYEHLISKLFYFS